MKTQTQNLVWFEMSVSDFYSNLLVSIATENSHLYVCNYTIA